MDNTIILLYNCEEIEQIAKKLNSTYTKDRLQCIYEYEIKPVMQTHNIYVTVKGETLPLKAFSGIRGNSKDHISKTDLVKLLALLFTTTNLLTFFRILPKRKQQLWLDVLNNQFVSIDKAEAILKQNLDSTHYSYFYYSNYYEKLALFEKNIFNFDEKRRKEYLHLPQSLMPLFNIILQAEYEPNGDVDEEDLIYEPKGRVINCEPFAIDAWLTIYDLFKQGIFTVGKTKLLTLSAIKKIAAQTRFVIPTPQGQLHDDTLYAMMVGTLVAYDREYQFRIFRTRDGGSGDTHHHFREICKCLFQSKFYLVTALLAYIRGICANDRLNCELGEVQSNINNILSFNSTNWITFDELLSLYRVNNKKQSTLTGLLPHNRYNEKNFVHVSTGKVIAPEQMVHYIGIPTIKAILILYNCMGWLEAEYRERDSTDSISPYDCIEAVRLTELGRYVLGLINSYTPPKIIRKKVFEASKNSLIVRLLETDSPYRQVLENMAEPIGNNRWSVTPAAMLANCHSIDDIDRKIEAFKNHIEPEPGEVWKKFFATMRKHCDPLKKEPLNNKYYLYSIDPANRDLVNIFMTDTIVRSLVIRAENQLLLVPVSNWNKLAKRLRELGYLL